MTTYWRTAHFLAFAAMAAVAALTVDRVVQPSMTETLLIALGLGLAVGLPGFVHQRALPISLILLPVGLYVLLRIVLPTPADVQTHMDEVLFYVSELRLGMRAYAEDVFPLSLGAVSGYELLLGVWVFLIVTVASVFALSGRALVLGTSLLVVLLGFTTTVDPRPSVVPTLLFLGCLVFALATSPGATRHVWRLRDALGGVGLGAAAVGLALLLLATFPGIVRPAWTNWKSYDPFGGGGSTVFVFNWKQNYPRLLDPGNAVPVMRVTSQVPSYWRATTLEFFTGNAWLSADSFFTPLPEGPGPRAIPRADPEPPGGVVDQTFELAGTSTNYIFTGGAGRSLTLDQPVQINVSDAGALRSSTMLTSPLQYEMTALVPRVSPEQLVGTTFDYPEDVRSRYLDLPFLDAATYKEVQEAEAAGEEPPPTSTTLSLTRTSEFDEIYALNDAIVGDADDPYEVTLRIERYLRTHYSYSLEVPRSPYISPIAAFLFDHKTGYCQHFSGSLAVLLRLNGIPARVAVGFTTGEQVGTWSFLVRSNNAHAWVEAYFAGVGWLPFDSTPGRPLPLAGPSSSSPGFVDPFAARAGDVAPGTPPVLPDAADRLPQDVETAGETPAAARSIPWGPIVAALFVAALAGWPFARRWARERPLHAGSPERRLRASVDLLRGDLLVAGVPVLPSSTLDEVAVLTGDILSLDLTPLARGVQRITFGGGLASDDDVAAAERTRAQVSRLAWKRQRLASLSAWYGVTPLIDWWRGRRSEGQPAAPALRKGPTWRLR